MEKEKGKKKQRVKRVWNDSDLVSAIAMNTLRRRAAVKSRKDRRKLLYPFVKRIRVVKNLTDEIVVY